MHDVVIIGGGQSGLAAARALHHRGLQPVILEAGPEPVGFLAALLRQPDRLLPGPMQLDARPAFPGAA